MLVQVVVDANQMTAEKFALSMIDGELSIVVNCINPASRGVKDWVPIDVDTECLTTSMSRRQ